MKSFIKKLFGKKDPAAASKKEENVLMTEFEYPTSEVNIRVSAFLSEITTLSSTVLSLYENTPEGITEDEIVAFRKARTEVARVLENVARNGDNAIGVVTSKNYYYVDKKTGERI